MKVINSIQDWKTLRQSNLFENKSIGFVPTMGNLHDGHASLIKKSASDNDFTIVSIFVNPTQFNNPDDLKSYPKTPHADINLAKSSGANFIFSPSYNDLYPDDYTYKVQETNLSNILEGLHRPSHFDGVLTVVLKLLLIISPSHAYFGEKDYQQFQLIKGMAEAFFLNTKIIPCPTIRSKDQLALSSRNSRLSEEQVELANQFPQILSSALSPLEITKNLEKLGFLVEYIQETNNRRFGAVKLGSVRLIDNIKINLT